MLSKGGQRLLGIGVIALAMLLVLYGTLRPNPFHDSESILAEFDKVQGLGRIDRNVRIAGANAGQIGSVEREGDKVVVELEIDPDISVRTDARVNLRPHTLFEGSAFVDLHPGSPSAPELEEGDLIPSEQTNTYTSLDEATRVLNEDNRQTIKDLVGQTREVLGEEAVSGLRKTLRRAPELVRDLGPTARALRGPKGDELAGAISGFADTVDGLATQKDELIPFAQHANATVEALRVDAGRPLDRALAALPGALEELEAASEPLTALLERVNTLGTSLKPAAQELAPLLRAARPLLRRTTPVIEQATPLIADLRVVLARATSAAPALRRAVEALEPGSRVQVNSLLPFLNSPSRFGLPVYAQLTQAFAGGDAVARSFQTPSQSPSNGHIIRAGAYLDPTLLPGSVVIPSCAVIAAINAELADQLETVGLCNP
jgi:phospholipid/cholesterol/gamma-HCH transport system substrate-binding protein